MMKNNCVQIKYSGVLKEISFYLKKEGIKTAIVTSSGRVKLQSFQAAYPEFVSMFDRILTAEDFSASKPDPDCYLKAAAALGCGSREYELQEIQ